MTQLSDISKYYRDAYTMDARVDYLHNRKLFGLEIELTQRCHSGCVYCYASSVKQWDTSNELTRAELVKVIDDALGMGVRAFSWPGGEPLLRKDWDFYLAYAKEKGGDEIVNFLASGMSPITPSKAKRLVEVADHILVHFDSIVKDTFRITHPSHLAPPNEWENALRGIHLLLEAGFDPKHMHLAIPIVKPLLPTIEATFDYFFDYIGVGSYSGGVFKPVGRGASADVSALAPTLDEIKSVYELRSKKMNNPAMLALGSSSIGKIYCATTIGINSEGEVRGCGPFPKEYVVANVRQMGIKEIWETFRDQLKCFDAKGYCAVCESSEICYGCRANALGILKDPYQSDPTCWKNPENLRLYNEYLTNWKPDSGN